MTEEPVYSCIKCGDSMTRGFLADRGQISYFLAEWIEGEPEYSKLLGITGSDVEVAERERHAVRALRCRGCGFLEFYAV